MIELSGYLPAAFYRTCIVFSFLSMGLSAYSQTEPRPIVNATFSGTVIDAITHEPILGATVQLEGVTHSQQTDQQGRFSFVTGQKLPATVIVTYVGYRKKVFTIEISPTTIFLEQDIDALDEVIVIGYGTQRKRDLTGAISTVDQSFIENRPLTNASQALQGVQGIYVNQPGGQPGNDGASIRIRGVGTLNNNDPLVLVNGIPYQLNDVNPADIASISVLKDAAAASIYGSRAANGVILITTKSGTAGKPEIVYNVYAGIQQATYLPDVVSNSADYMAARNQASVNEGQPLVFSDETLAAFRTGTDPDLYPNTDWFDLMFRNAPIQDHNVRISGGNESAAYSVSLNYLNQDGVMLETGAKKYALHTNLQYNVSKRFKAGLTMTGTYWDRHEPAEGAKKLADNITRALPFHAPVLQNGNYADQLFLVPGHNVFRNPYAKAREGGLDTKTQRLLVNAFGEYTLPFGLVYKANVAVNKYDALAARFVPKIGLYNANNPTVESSILRYDNPTPRSATRYDYNNIDASFFQTLSWDKTINDNHHVTALLGYSQESFTNTDFHAYIEGFLGNELTELDAGTINQDVSGTSSKSKLMSYFGRAAYNFDSRYFFEFNFRNDGSSRFAKGNRWGFFPAVAGAWKISGEPFLQHVDAIDDLKIRASWGKLGNQNIPLYSYLNGVDIGQGYSFNGTTVPGSAVVALSDDDISWETTTSTNIGLDLSLWDGAFGLVLDVYDKKTTDILAQVNVPAQVGNLRGPVTNLYGLSNRGLEVGLSHRRNVNRFGYDIQAGITLNKNNVDFLNGDVQYSGDGSLWVIKQGYSVNSYYLYEADGIFQTEEEIAAHAFQSNATAPGDIRYKDIDGNNIIDSDDRIITGRTVPKYTYQFNLGLTYQRFQLSTFFQGVQGVDGYPIYNLAFPLYNGAGLTHDQLGNSWTPDRPDAKYPRLGEPKRGSGINYKNSTFWLQDASYLRLKNIALSYDIPESVTAPIGIRKIKCFVNAQNLLTFSRYKLTDPERDLLQQDIAEYPAVKTFTFGLNVNF